MIKAISTLLLANYAFGLDFQEHATFQSVFGLERVNTHFGSVNRFSSAVDDIRSTSKESQSEHEKHITCSSYLDGREAKLALSARFGEANIHTVHTSAAEDLACFVVVSHLDAMESFVSSNDIFRSTTPIPESMKIHHSAMYYFDLIESKHITRSIERTGLRNKRDVPLEDLELIIEHGIGIRKPNSKIFAGMDVHTTNKLKSNPHVHLDNFNTFSTDEDVWSSSARKLKESADVEDMCMFSQLEIKQVKNTVVVDNIQVIMQSANPRACYASLLASLASDKTAIDIRVRGKNKVNNNYTKGVIQTGVRQMDYPYHDAGINGTGQIVGIGDTGVDDSSCFFVNADGETVPRSEYTDPTFDLSYRKVIQYVAYANGFDTMGGHGTHVSGTVAGNVINDEDGSYVQYGGNAPGAKIAFFDMSTNGQSITYPSPLSEYVFGSAYAAGARLHSNSWGSVLNIYDPETVDIDAYLYETPAFLVLFAGGNDGSEGYYSIGSPAVSKNVISIGATMSSENYTDSMAFFSGIGPTFDGRIKPDISAPGYFTTSANASDSPGLETCYVISMAGTSMATPAAAGVGATIRHYFADEKFYASMCNPDYPLCMPFDAAGATIKAALIHSGEPMELYNQNQYPTEEPPAALNMPPDMYQGFGRIFMQNVLPYTGIEEVIDLYVEEIVMDALTKITYTVQVTDNSRPVKATIVWMDPPNSIISGKVLLHDIDLKITQGNTVVYGNNVAGDDINNVEQAVVYSPIVGTYTVTLTSKVFTEADTQNVSLIITSGGEVTGFSVSAVTEEQAYNPLNCADDEQMVTVVMMDRGGDGWGDDNSYAILDSDNNVVHSNTMSSAIPDDFLVYDKFCLPNGKYTAQLVQEGTNTNQMGIDISQCSTYLSEYKTSDSFTLSDDGTCNTCNGYILDIYLIGSVYGVPYGWHQGSKYVLTKDGVDEPLYEGTLITGVVDTRYLCITTPGDYWIALTGVPADDDYFPDDAYIAEYVGVNEYRIGIKGCDFVPANGTLPALFIGANQSVAVNIDTEGHVFVEDVFCTQSGVTKSPTKMPTAPTASPSQENNPDADGGNDDTPVTETTGFIVGITIGVIAFVAVVGGMMWVFRSKIFRPKPSTPLLSNAH